MTKPSPDDLLQAALWRVSNVVADEMRRLLEVGDQDGAKRFLFSAISTIAASAGASTRAGDWTSSQRDALIADMRCNIDHGFAAGLSGKTKRQQ